MGKSRLFFLLIIIQAFLASSGCANPTPALRVADLVDKSDLIIVGRVLKTTPLSLNGDVRQALVVTVDQTLKGSAERGRQVSVNIQQAVNVGRDVEEGLYGTFFLRARPNGGYEVVEPVYPDIVASPRYAHDKPQLDDPLTEVAIELAWVLATPAADLASPASGVHHRPHLGRGCDDPSIVMPVVKPCTVPTPKAWQGQAIFYEAADALRTLSYPTVRPQMALLLKSRQELTRMWAAGVLLSFDDVAWIQDELSPLPLVVPFLMKQSLDDKLTRDWIAYRLSAMQAVASNVAPLATLLKSPDLTVRRQVAHALAQIYSPEIIEPLVGVLGDPDLDVRYYASNGLAFVTKARPQETPEAFRIDGADTMQFWTNWVRTRPR